jgi:hypothetical protein
LHYGAKTNVPLEKLKAEYKRVNALSPEDATKGSPLKVQNFEGEATPYKYYEATWPLTGGPDVARKSYRATNQRPDEDEIKKIIGALDAQHRWMIKHVQISRPFSVSATGVETNTAKLSDESGKGIVDSSDQQYISTKEYAKNMRLLISYITEGK